MKYRVTVSGWVEVTVDATDVEDAKEKALENEIVGHLYDWQVEEVQVA